MPKAPRLRLSLVLAVVISALSVATALGYAGETAKSVTVSGPTGQVQCDTTYALKATVIGNSGTGVPGKLVSWLIVSSPSGATDTLSPASSTTDASGVATTTITFGGVVGSRTIRATADNAFGQLVLNPTSCGTPTPTETVAAATSKPHITLAPTDVSTPGGSGGGNDGLPFILLMLLGIAAFAPIVAKANWKSQR